MDIQNALCKAAVSLSEQHMTMTAYDTVQWVCSQAGNNVLVAIGKRLGLILRRGAQEVFIDNTKQSVGSVAHRRV